MKGLKGQPTACPLQVTLCLQNQRTRISLQNLPPEPAGRGMDVDIPIHTHLVFIGAERRDVCCQWQRSSSICALGSSCEKYSCISVIACCFLVLRKPPAVLITLSGVPFANGLLSPVMGIFRPSPVKRSSSEERNNSHGGEHGSKTKPNANRTLLRDV